MEGQTMGRQAHPFKIKARTLPICRIGMATLRSGFGYRFFAEKPTGLLRAKHQRANISFRPSPQGTHPVIGIPMIWHLENASRLCQFPRESCGPGIGSRSQSFNSSNSDKWRLQPRTLLGDKLARLDLKPVASNVHGSFQKNMWHLQPPNQGHRHIALVGTPDFQSSNSPDSGNDIAVSSFVSKEESSWHRVVSNGGRRWVKENSVVLPCSIPPQEC